MSGTKRSLIIPAAAAALVAAPVVAGAQTIRKLVITPYAGVFAPTNDLARAVEAGGGTRARLDLKQKAALAIGGNASYWLTERTALEVGAAYAFSDARATTSLAGHGEHLSFTGTEDAYAVLGSAKFMVSLLPPRSPMSLRLGVGPAIIHRGGDAYDADEDGEITGLTDVGGAISLCTKVPITRSIALRLRGENFMYSSRLRFKDPVDPADDFEFKSRFQNDLLFSAGLQLAFGW